MAVSIPNAGELKKRAYFYEFSQTPSSLSSMDDYENEFNLSFLYSVWCKLEAVGMQLFFESAQTEKSVTHRIWLRKIKGKTDIQTLSAHILRLKVDHSLYKVKRVQELNEWWVMAELSSIELIPEVLHGN